MGWGSVGSVGGQRGMGSVILLLLTSLLLLLLIVGGKQKPKLNIAGFFPLSKNSSRWRVGQGVLPAVQQALYDINKNSSILPEYELSILWNDTKVRLSLSLYILRDLRPVAQLVTGRDSVKGGRLRPA